MRKTDLIKVIAAALAAAVLSVSCTPWKKAEQNKWIKEMGEVFPDDEFEYIGHPSTTLPFKDYDRVLVSSELYDTTNVCICEKDGRLYSNYLAFVHEDACRDEFDRIFSGAFPCSNFEVSGYVQRFDYYTVYPVEDISAEKFIRKYMDFDCQLFLFYEDGKGIPTEDEMMECITDLVKSEPHAYKITIFCADAKYSREEAITHCTVDYRLVMDEDDNIKSLYVDYKDGSENDRYLIRDMDI